MPEHDASHGSFTLPADVVRDPDGTWHVRLPSGHAVFAGHFPGEPILPGIAHLELVAAALAREATGPVTIASIREIRFLRPILPDEDVALRIESSPTGACRFELRVGGVLASRGELCVELSP